MAVATLSFCVFLEIVEKADFDLENVYKDSPGDLGLNLYGEFTSDYC